MSVSHTLPCAAVIWRGFSDARPHCSNGTVRYKKSKHWRPRVVWQVLRSHALISRPGHALQRPLGATALHGVCCGREWRHTHAETPSLCICLLQGCCDQLVLHLQDFVQRFMSTQLLEQVVKQCIHFSSRQVHTVCTCPFRKKHIRHQFADCFNLTFFSSRNASA